MPRQRFCKVCRGWHELDNWPHNCMPERNYSRSELSAPMIIRDGMEPVVSMLDGKTYDSKRSLRATYKAAGVVEVGDDKSVSSPEHVTYQRESAKKEIKTKARKGIEAAVGKALSRAGLGA